MKYPFLKELKENYQKENKLVKSDLKYLYGQILKKEVKSEEDFDILLKELDFVFEDFKNINNIDLLKEIQPFISLLNNSVASSIEYLSEGKDTLITLLGPVVPTYIKFKCKILVNK